MEDCEACLHRETHSMDYASIMAGGNPSKQTSFLWRTLMDISHKESSRTMKKMTRLEQEHLDSTQQHGVCALGLVTLPDIHQ